MRKLYKTDYGMRNEGTFKSSYYLLVDDNGTPKKLLFNNKKNAYRWLKS